MTLPLTIERRHLAAGNSVRACAAALAILLAAVTVTHAQSAPKNAPAPPQPQPTVSSAPPNALQGFAQNRDKPIRIDAERLEVRDKQKVATFFGDAKADVKVVQGDVTIRSKILVVFYDQDDAAKAGADKSGAAKSAAAGPGPGGGGSQIRRLEAKGNVIVTQKDQTVTGELGVFDMKTNVATVSGGVVMTQCDNVVRGERLIVDMTTGVSRVESSGGRVQSTLVQSQPGGGCSVSAPPAPAPRR